MECIILALLEKIYYSLFCEQKMEPDDIDAMLFGIPQAKHLKDIVKSVAMITSIPEHVTGDGTKRPCFVLGYPCDIGTKRAHGRPGQERAPCI